jgi:hypothetical protein
MAGSNSRGSVRETKFVTEQSYAGLVAANSPPRFNPPAPDNTGNPLIDPTTGKPYPRG